MFGLLVFLVLAGQVQGSRSSCHTPDSGGTCTQTSKVRHEVRYPDHSPSYCYYGDKERFKARKRCGWRSISERACQQAGCCYRYNTCFYPIRPAEVMTYYLQKWVTLAVANETCAQNYMSLYCVQHKEDLEFVSRATCGSSWLAGQVAPDDDIIEEGVPVSGLPFSDPKTCSNEENVFTRCERDSWSRTGLSLSRSDDTYSISNITASEKRNLFCVYEIWTPTFELFPRHVEAAEGTRKRMKCSANQISVDGRAIMGQNLTWTISDRNGTTRTIKNKKTIAVEEIGKYTCEIALLLKPGIEFEGKNERTNERTHVISSYAYHFLPIQYISYITIQSIMENTPRVNRQLLGNENPIPFQLLLGDKVTLEIEFEGYPIPEVDIVSSSEDPAYRNAKHFRHPVEGVWIMDTFGEMNREHTVWMYQEEHVESVEVRFLPETQPAKQLGEIRFQLQKVFIVQQIDTAEREFTLKLNETRCLQCYGYGVGSLTEARASWTIDEVSSLERGIDIKRLDSTEVISGENCPKTPGGKGFIAIRPDSAKYSGNYVCKLDNGAGTIDVSYTIKVVAPPQQPEPAILLLDNRVSVLKYKIPMADEKYEVTTYNVSIQTDNATVHDVSFSINENNTVSTFGELDFDITVNEFDFIIVQHRNLDKENLRYRMTYCLTNEHGNSKYSHYTPWSVPHTQFDSSLRVTVLRRESTITDSSIEITFRKPELTLVNVTYFAESDDVEKSQTVTVPKDGISVMIEDLQKSTRYVFYLQAFLASSDGEGKMGPFTDALIFTTAEARFDKEAYKPADLNVQQIAFEEAESRAVVLVRWSLKNDLPLSLVRSFKRRLKIIDDPYDDDSEDELEKRSDVTSSMGELEKRSDVPSSEGVVFLPSTSTSEMVEIINIRKDKIYSFTMKTVSVNGEQSARAKFAIKLSPERCPVPPPAPKICGVLVRNGYQLMVLVNDETSGLVHLSGCYTGIGENYTGHVYRTMEGELCQNWADTQSNYTNLEKNYCRNPGNAENQTFHGPWCYTSRGEPAQCNVWPCGKYLHNMTFQSGQQQLSGTKLCVNKMTSDTNMKLVTWYDFGRGAPTCGGNETVLNLEWSDMMVESEKISNYNSSRRTIWYRYIWLVLGNIQIMAVISLIIFCKQRIIKTVEEEQKSQRRKENLKSAFSASSK